MGPFKDWLKNKMSAAKMTAAETKEFTLWLVNRRKSGEGKLDTKSAVTCNSEDVREFFAWLGKRISEEKLDHTERHQLHDWLTARVEQSPDVGDLDSHAAQTLNDSLNAHRQSLGRKDND